MMRHHERPIRNLVCKKNVSVGFPQPVAFSSFFLLSAFKVENSLKSVIDIREATGNLTWIEVQSFECPYGRWMFVFGCFMLICLCALQVCEDVGPRDPEPASPGGYQPAGSQCSGVRMMPLYLYTRTKKTIGPKTRSPQSQLPSTVIYVGCCYTI